MRSAPFHNGFGMMTVTGTRKPVWRAFELLMDAGTERLAVTGSDVSPGSTDSTVSVLATKGGKGAGPMGLQLFVANYRRLLSVTSYSCDHTTHQCVADQRGDYTDEGACNADCKASSSSSARPTGENGHRTSGLSAAAPGHPWPPLAHSVTIHVTHTAGMSMSVPATATLQRIDSTHANAFAEWTGKPPTPHATVLLSLFEWTFKVSSRRLTADDKDSAEKRGRMERNRAPH